MTVRVKWDRTPISVHSEHREVLEGLMMHLRNVHNVRKRSIIMPDREEGGFLFFIYQVCDPRWIAEYLNGGRPNG